MASVKSNFQYIPELSLQIDNTDPSNVYIGYAKPGVATSASVWQIKKLVTSGGNISFLYVNHDPAFKYIWDSRASYSYS